ncbi:nitrite reductase NAD(P)H small subunit [Marinithermofilum abyssi]|uniref:Nitrite reductase NAD(P)H small subunit n=1 Tax=Marinithermofilum abyssi TaxID=1571185 RepID=A0A8J2VBW6_9BACL|nr:nitrite reductase small subunit NirD [Marinithermofilum abyssi]GGE15357.1 nitrite reductase NAD(P)H small subunit [Marinithermofilum abyssi]
MKKVVIGSKEDLPRLTGKAVVIDGVEVAVFRLSNGEVKAVENRCPHRGGPLAEGVVSGEFVFCPLHEWKICLTDGKVQEPDPGCVKTYPVEAEGNEVRVFLAEESVKA